VRAELGHKDELKVGLTSGEILPIRDYLGGEILPIRDYPGGVKGPVRVVPKFSF
jgi:hypothetical protein